VKSHPLFEKKRIFAPGPTPVPQEVLAELSRPPLHHRTKEFIAILERVKKNLQFLFQTNQPAYVLSASGTGAMEATVVNLFASGDKVLVINAGKFGERFMKLSQKFGLDTQVMNLEWGHSADPEAVRKFLKTNPDTRGVLFQASETSTATEHPVEAIAKAVHEASDALVVVDAITALGVIDLPLDKWGLDAVVSGSQKALMLPPGLAFLSLSERAQKARARANIPRFYYDLVAEDKAASKGETAWTPAVGLIMALDVVLARVVATGLDPIFTFHRRLAEATRRGTKALGLELFSKGIPSTAVTAVHVPASIPEGKKIVSHLRDRYGITIAGGQDAWTGKIFRLAHLGYYDELDMLQILAAVELTLNKLGHRCEYGKGVAAAAAYLA
jgi:aspartate aminotransferase-like enzyme